MKRVELLGKVETVARALATNDILPIMTHLHLTGKELVAYNGSVAISVPLATDFQCCVPGQVFLSLLKAAGAKEVEIEMDSENLLIRGAATRVKLPTMGSDAFSFVAPKPPTERLRVDGKALVAAMRACLRSISSEASRPDQLGVTIMPEDGPITHYYLWATDGKTLTRAAVKFKGAPFPKRVCLPKAFCKHFVDLYDEGTLYSSIEDDVLVLSWGDGNKAVTMSGSFIQADKPMPYRDVFARYVKPDSKQTFVPVAPRLARILGRACIVAQGDVAAIRTRIVVRSGTAKFYTKSKVGEVRDSMGLANGHPDVEIEVDPKAFSAGCGDFDRMVITEDCVSMANEFAYYLISGKE
jgi:hypothetical protein